MTLVLLGDQSPKVHRNSSLHDKPMSNIESLFHYCSFLSIDFIWFHLISFDFIWFHYKYYNKCYNHSRFHETFLSFQQCFRVSGWWRSTPSFSPYLWPGLRWSRQGAFGSSTMRSGKSSGSPGGSPVPTGFDMFRHVSTWGLHDISWFTADSMVFSYISHRILAYFSSIYFHHKSLKFGALLSFVPADKWTSGASLRQLLTFGWWILSWPSRWHWRIKTIAGVVFDLTCAPWLHELDDKRECMKTWVSMHPTSFW